MSMSSEMVAMTSGIVSAFVSNNTISKGEIGDLIQSVHGALSGLETPISLTAPEDLTPAVSIRASVKPDYVTCLECGFKGKMLKRHLAAEHGLSEKDYKAKWGLKADHPLTAPNYTEKRREIALNLGLGRKRKGGKA